MIKGVSIVTVSFFEEVWEIMHTYFTSTQTLFRTLLTVLWSNPDCSVWFLTKSSSVKWSEHTYAYFRTGGFKSFMDANHCFCLNLLLGNLWKLSPLPCLFLQPIAAHDFTIFLVWYKFLCNLCRELLPGALLLDTMHRGSLETGCDPCHPLVSQLIALEKHGRTQWLAEAVQEDDNTQKSPLTGSLREKEW